MSDLGTSWQLLWLTVVVIWAKTRIEQKLGEILDELKKQKDETKS